MRLLLLCPLLLAGCGITAPAATLTAQDLCAQWIGTQMDAKKITPAQARADLTQLQAGAIPVDCQGAH